MLCPCVITETFPPDRGGMAQSCDRIVRGLRARDVLVDVVHLSPRHKGFHVEQHEGGKLVCCEVEEDQAHTLNMLWNALSRSDLAPSHVLAFGGFLPLLAAPSFAAWWGVPLLALLRGNDFDLGLFSAPRGFVLRDALARAAAIAAVTRDHQRKVSRLFPAQRVDYIPNGIDARDWELLDIDRARAERFRLEVAPERRVIGLFGQLKRKKGGVFFLDALAACGGAARCHLLVVGDLEAAMTERLDAFGAELAVTRLPFLDRLELLPWYAACDVIAIPSFYDGMPNVLLEAGALAVPVLASSAGGMADLLVDGENALTFAAGDLHGCVRALTAALRLPKDALRRLGESLQATVRERFDQRIEAERYHELLLETAPAAPRKG